MKDRPSGWKNRRIEKGPAAGDEVDEASEDSFPASDPPGWSGMRIGPPDTRGRPHLADVARDKARQEREGRPGKARR
jgi:hypothetical protein